MKKMAHRRSIVHPMKRINYPCIAASVACIFLLLAVFSCKKEEFPEPEKVFKRWSTSLKSLNYAEYRACEAFPKEEGVFRDMYRITYYTDCTVREFEDIDNDKTKLDANGNSYQQKKVWFECAEVRRDTGRQVRALRGEVIFIKYLNGERTGHGWLMWNRSFYRMEP